MAHSYTAAPCSTVSACCPIASSSEVVLPSESSTGVEAASAFLRIADSDKLAVWD